MASPDGPTMGPLDVRRGIELHTIQSFSDDQRREQLAAAATQLEQLDWEATPTTNPPGIVRSVPDPYLQPRDRWRNSITEALQLNSSTRTQLLARSFVYLSADTLAEQAASGAETPILPRTFSIDLNVPKIQPVDLPGSLYRRLLGFADQVPSLRMSSSLLQRVALARVGMPDVLYVERLAETLHMTAKQADQTVFAIEVADATSLSYRAYTHENSGFGIEGHFDKGDNTYVVYRFTGREGD